MDLSDLVRSLGRRWWATLLGIAATVFLVQYVYGMIPQTYESQASMVLLPPTIALDKTTNPYLGLSGLQAITDVLSRSMSDGPVHDGLAPKGGSATLKVTRDTTASGPMLVIDVTDTTASGAGEILTNAVDAAPAQLHALQASVGVAAPDEIRIVPVTHSAEPTASNKGQIRAVILAAVVGLALTLFLVSLIDNVLIRRSRRRAALVEPDEALGPRERPGDPELEPASVERDMQRVRDDGEDAEQIVASSPIPKARAPR